MVNGQWLMVNELQISRLLLPIAFEVANCLLKWLIKQSIIQLLSYSVIYQQIKIKNYGRRIKTTAGY
jgi:hypothetical protein